MEKPVFSSDILSFCKEMGVTSPEELIGKRIYLKYFFQEEDDEEKKEAEIIFISKISEIVFRVCTVVEDDKEEKVAIINTLGGNNDDLRIFYYLDEKKLEIRGVCDLCESYLFYASIKEIYVFPDSVE